MKLKLALATAILFLSTSSLAKRHYVTEDFFIEKLSQEESSLWRNSSRIADNENCRDHIKTVMCLVDPGEEGKIPKEGRPCLAGGENYAHFFETLYDNYPPALQRMFCSLNYIYVEKKFFGTAYAGLIYDEKGKILGAQMGIRQSVLDEQLNLTTWSSWKEQLSFGGVKDSYTVLPHLPKYETASPSHLSDFLYFVVAHEFGHIFDFANNVNKTKNCPENPDKQEQPECEMDENGWGGISWITDKKAKAENEFTYRTSLCFYWCEGKTIDSLLIPKLYNDLFATQFISTYATTQPWDDFADSLAYFLMNRHLSSSVVLHNSEGESYNIMAKLKSPLWLPKWQYIERFLARKDIAYP